MSSSLESRKRHLAAITAALLAVLVSVPLTGGGALADTPSCATAETAAQTSQANLDSLLSQLSAAEKAESNDQAAIDEVTKDIASDNDVIQKYKDLESATDDASAIAQKAINEALGADKEVKAQPFNVVQEFALEKISENLHEEITEMTNLTRLISNNSWKNAAFLARLEQAQAAATLEFITLPALKLFQAVGTAVLAKDLGSLITADATLGTDLLRLNSMEADDKRASREIDALKARLTALQAQLAKDAGNATTLSGQVAAAQSAAQQALETAATACEPGSAPPAPTPPDHATTWGDPHLVTFDGVHYDFQQVGEFILAKSTVDDFQIQVRQRPWAGTSQTVAENAAVAFEVAGHRVGVYVNSAGTSVSTLVDGQSVTLSSTTPYTLPGGGTITSAPWASQETVSWPNGSVVTVDYSGGHYITLDVAVSAAEHGHLVGLLGNDDGNATGDLVTRTGTVLPGPPAATDLYGEFSGSWRIAQSESLFDYAAGQATATFTDLKFPYAPAALSGLSASATASATAICQAAGVTTEPFLDDCVLDVAETGDPRAALASINAQGFRTPAAPGGGLVENGSFEQPSDEGNLYIEYDGGSTDIPGWTVTGGSVDLTSSGYWQADDGTQSLDLAGSAPGGVTQSVATTAGDTYVLSWSLAGNTNCGDSVKTMDVEWNGTVVDAPAFDTAGQSNSSMGYVHDRVTVTATGSSSSIGFSDATAGDSLCGPVLDNVSLARRG